MSSKNNEQTFCIKNPTIQNIKHFVCKGKQYMINFDLLIINSKYFYNNQQQYENIEFIPLLNDIESSLDIPEESIEAFISSCQNNPFQINNLSVIPLQYLSIKYDYPSLTKVTNEFIDKHSEELVLQTLLFKTQINESKINKIDTKNEENIISKDIFKYIKDEKMLLLPISVLNRIIQNYYNNIESNQKSRNQEIIDFLFKTIDKYGKDASILFNNIDFHEEKIHVVNRLINEYSDKFDFNYINSTLLKTTTELSSEMTKQREEFRLLFNDMKKEIENQKKELNSLKKEQIKQIDEIEKRYQKQVFQLREEIEKITSENKQQMNIIQKQFDQIIEKNEKIVGQSKINQIDQIIHTMMNSNQLKELEEGTRKDFLKEIIERERENSNSNKNENKFIQQIMCIHGLFENIFPNNDDFESEIKYILENIEKPCLTFEHVNILYQNNSLSSILTDLLKNYDYFEIEINYPSDLFNQISKTINENKKLFPKLSNKTYILFNIIYQNNNQKDSPKKFNYYHMAIKIKCQDINENTLPNIIKSYHKKLCESIKKQKIEFPYSKLLTQIAIPSSVNSIGDSAFRNCSSLTQILIPSSVNLIGECAFSYCSSLTQISIPSSVKSIGRYAFDTCTSLIQIEIPSSINSIGDGAFSNCSSLKQIQIPSSVNSIEENLFYNCSSLIQISIPSSVKSIGYKAFSYCSSLVQISIPSSVKSIGNEAFRYCSSLIQIQIPSSIEKIGYYIFRDCPLIQDLLPSSFK